MCGIAGYVGPREAIGVVYDQLKRLEYRGYDSAGIAYLDGAEIRVVKKAGKLSRLGEVLASGGVAYLEGSEAGAHDGRPGHSASRVPLAIGHSRWATHGGPTDENAHPHFDEHGEVAIIHNGIIENYLELREDLLGRGHHFRSQTDTEVAAHVIGEEFEATKSIEEAVRRASKMFRGAYSIVAVAKSEPERIIAVRQASPLVLGIGVGESFLASDIPALLPYTREVVIMEEGTLAVLETGGIRLTDADGRERPLEIQHIDWDVAAAERGGYAHFMLKEIHEQPAVFAQAIAGRVEPASGRKAARVQLDGVFAEHVWMDVDRVNIIACGTAYHAGLMGKHLFESLLRLPTDVYYSSEFRYGDPVLSPRSLAIFVSQSGETADTLAALRLCKSRRIRTLGVVNVIGSSIARECDRTILTQAGPEICVASTKAYTAQVTALTLLALNIAQVQETPGVVIGDWVEELGRLPELAKKVLELEPEIESLAAELRTMPLAFFLGRGADAFVALEGALKLKEIAYIPTQESPAGEMKHGPLALVQPGVAAIFGATDPAVRDKVVSNMKEVQARGGTVVAITTDDDQSVGKAADKTVKIPRTKFDFLNALLAVIPLQLFAYHVARMNGCEIDQPRNLAKSVTVE